MSFGWSASDIALLVKLAYKTTQGARAACGQYDELTQDTSSLHTILNRLHLEVAKPESSINRQESYGRELKSIATGCEDVLTQLDKILVKYNALSEQERSARRLWKKIRFGNGAVADVAELRSRVTYYTSALSLFLNLVSVGTVGAAEKKMDQAGGDLRDIKSAVNYITAHFLAAERREGSVLTAYTNDDRDAWRELRRGLVKAGFRDSFVRKHMNTIMAYVKELDDKGVLDDIVTDEAGSPTDLAHGSNDSEGSLGADQKAGSSFTTRSSAARKAPVIEDGDHEERPPESGENFQLSQPSEPNSCMKIPETLETDPGLLYNDRPSPDLSKRSGSSTFVAQDSQSAMVDGQTLKPNSQPCEHNIQGSRQYKEADFLKPENLRYYISTVPGPSSKSGMIFLDDMALPAFIADHSIIYTNSAPTRFTDPCRLCSLLLSFRLRVMSLMDPNGLFKPEDHDLWIEAVDLLLYPVISNDDSYVDESLYVYFDIRQITTLCSMYAVEFLRARDRLALPWANNPQLLYDNIHNWLLKFDQKRPENIERLQQRLRRVLYHPHLLGIWTRTRRAKVQRPPGAAPSPLRRRATHTGNHCMAGKNVTGSRKC